MASYFPTYLLQVIIIISFFHSSFQWEKTTSLTIKDQFYYCHDSVQIEDLVTFDHCESQSKKSNRLAFNPKVADLHYDTLRENYLKDISKHLQSLKFPITLPFPDGGHLPEAFMTPRLLARDIYQVYGSGITTIIVCSSSFVVF